MPSYGRVADARTFRKMPTGLSTLKMFTSGDHLHAVWYRDAFYFA